MNLISNCFRPVISFPCGIGKNYLMLYPVFYPECLLCITCFGQKVFKNFRMLGLQVVFSHMCHHG